MNMHAARSLVAAVLVSLTIGCGGDGTYHVSGKVTFKGQPVPAGKIYFKPDGAKGNTGPTGYADIKNGAYNTASAGGKGSVGGAVVIGLEGIDPSGPGAKEKSPDVTAKVLFPWWEVKVDMPKASTTKDIDVPAEAAKGPVAPKPIGIVP